MCIDANLDLDINPEDYINEDLGIINNNQPINNQINNPYLQAGRQMQRRIINQII